MRVTTNTCFITIVTIIELVAMEKICNVGGNRGLKIIACLTEKEDKGVRQLIILFMIQSKKNTQ